MGSDNALLIAIASLIAIGFDCYSIYQIETLRQSLLTYHFFFNQFDRFGKPETFIVPGTIYGNFENNITYNILFEDNSVTNYAYKCPNDFTCFGNVIIVSSASNAWGHVSNINGGSNFMALQSIAYVEMNIGSKYIPERYGFRLYDITFESSHRLQPQNANVNGTTLLDVFCNGVNVLSFRPSAIWQSHRTQCKTDASGYVSIKFLNGQSPGIDRTVYIDNINITYLETQKSEKGWVNITYFLKDNNNRNHTYFHRDFGNLEPAFEYKSGYQAIKKFLNSNYNNGIYICEGNLRWDNYDCKRNKLCDNLYSYDSWYSSKQDSKYIQVIICDIPGSNNNNNNHNLPVDDDSNCDSCARDYYTLKEDQSAYSTDCSLTVRDIIVAKDVLSNSALLQITTGALALNCIVLLFGTIFFFLQLGGSDFAVVSKGFVILFAAASIVTVGIEMTYFRAAIRYALVNDYSVSFNDDNPRGNDEEGPMLASGNCPPEVKLWVSFAKDAYWQLVSSLCASIFEIFFIPGVIFFSLTLEFFCCC